MSDEQVQNGINAFQLVCVALGLIFAAALIKDCTSQATQKAFTPEPIQWEESI